MNLQMSVKKIYARKFAMIFCPNKVQSRNKESWNTMLLAMLPGIHDCISSSFVLQKKNLPHPILQRWASDTEV